MNEVRESSAKIFINSANQSNWKGGTSTSLSVAIQPFILRSDDPTHFVIGIESLSVPLALFVVNSTNNLISIAGTSYSIPEGNYTTTTLTTALNEQTGTTVTWKFSLITNKLEATFAGPASFGGTAQTLLGYTNGNSKSSPYTFENTINLAFTTGIVVRLDNITTENRCPIVGGGSGVLGRIPITVAPFKVLQYFNASPFYTTINQRSIQTIEVSLLDDNYAPLVLVGNPVWSITLRIDYADKSSKDNAHSMLEKAATKNVLSTKHQMILN